MALQSMIALASITLQEASASVTFSSIPQNYQDLVLTFRASNSAAGLTYSTIRVNGQTGSIYSRIIMAGLANNTTLSLADTTTSLETGDLAPNEATFEIHQFMDYFATDKHKTVLYRTNDRNATIVAAGAGRIATTSPITTILVGTAASSFAAGSTFNLYGRIA
jgi:hypothetical protein